MNNNLTYGIEDFYSINKIDAHTHILLDSNYFLEEAKKNNFQCITIMADVPYYPYPSIAEQEEIILSQKEIFPNRINYVTTFDLTKINSDSWEKDTIAYLSKSIKNGAVAVKVWKNIGMEIKDQNGEFIMIDNPKFDKILNFLEEQNISLLGHIGEPKNCWLPVEKMTVNSDKEYFTNHPEYHMYLLPEYPAYQTIIDARDNMLAKHPNLTFIGCHLGSLEWSVDELASHFDKYPNMVVDLAGRVCHLQYQSKIDREKTRDFIIKYQDRILYGTDLEATKEEDPNEYPKIMHNKWLEDWKYFTSDLELKVEEVDGTFEGLSLPRNVINKIYFTNAKKWILDNK